VSPRRDRVEDEVPNEPDQCGFSPRAAARPAGGPSTLELIDAGRKTERVANVNGGVDVSEMNNTARPSVRLLLAEVRDVVHDLPVLLSAPLYRRWHLHWGATPAETLMPLPGDAIIPRAQYRSTRAITIDAPPRAVWPWLVQVGARRAGFYSNDLLDSLARPSATTILPRFQHLEVGQWIAMSPTSPPTDSTALKVDSFAVEQWLLWTKPDGTWAWRLAPTGSGGTRLVTRIHASYDWAHPLTALFSMLLMEFGDFAMLRRMLWGIKQRAESPICGDGITRPPPDARDSANSAETGSGQPLTTLQPMDAPSRL
jgi:hypothetical protein